jgi:choline dehydrogenase-like flavoprotein
MPAVLLVEAGSPNECLAHATEAERFQAAFGPDPSTNWGYKTEPQAQLNGQEINYPRGKGLGGSTLTNFCAWTVGPRDDYDKLAFTVQDKRFRWENVQRVLKRVEGLDSWIPSASIRGMLGMEEGCEYNLLDLLHFDMDVKLTRVHSTQPGW